MCDNNEDEDDFDIYGDLEDSNDDKNNLIDINLSETQSDCNQNKNIINNNLNNDLILSEMTIMEKSLANTENNNKDLIKQNEELRQQLVKRDKQNLILKANISSLYKTAKAEIERKKREISELREDYDSLVFKRLNNKNNNYNRNVDNCNDNKVEKTVQLSAKKFCNKSTNTSDVKNSDYFKLNNHKKNNNECKNTIESHPKSRLSRRSRSRSRSRSRHRNSGERGYKRAKESEDSSRDRHRSDAKFTKLKRHKCDKHS